MAGMTADDRKTLRQLAERYGEIAQLDVQREPVEREIVRYCEACRKHGVTLEVVLKDISAIANDPGNLTTWASTVNAVLDRYY